MALYRYTGVRENGETCKGIMEGDNEDRILKILRGERIYPIDINKKIQIKNIFKVKKLSYKEISKLCNNLYTAYSSGLSIEKSLNLVYEKESKPEVKNILKNINKNIYEGKELSTSLRSYGKMFPRLMISMILIGEKSGTMDKVLFACSDYYAKLHDFKKKIKGASIYPIFTISTAFIVFFFIIRCVLPTLVSSLYEDTMKLPYITRFIMNISSWLSFKRVSISLLVLFTMIMIIKNKNKKNNKRSSLKYKFPIIKKFNLCIDNYVVMYSLNILLSSGISIIEAVDIASLTVESNHMKKGMFLCTEKLKKGYSICEAFREIGTFSKYDLSMIDLGQESGKIDYMFKKLSDEYFVEINDKLEFMKKIIEPILILFVGLLVLLIVMSVYLPILYSIEDII